MIIAPLLCNDVDALIKAKLKILVLSLNEGSIQALRISQFSRVKKGEAGALKHASKKIR